MADLIPPFIRPSVSAAVGLQVGREAKEKECAASKGVDAAKSSLRSDDDDDSEMDIDDDEDVEEALGGTAVGEAAVLWRRR